MILVGLDEAPHRKQRLFRSEYPPSDLQVVGRSSLVPPSFIHMQLLLLFKERQSQREERSTIDCGTVVVSFNCDPRYQPRLGAVIQTGVPKLPPN